MDGIQTNEKCHLWKPHGHSVFKKKKLSTENQTHYQVLAGVVDKHWLNSDKYLTLNCLQLNIIVQLYSDKS